MISSILKSQKHQYFSVTILCFLCYGFSLNGNFVFDDSVAIVRNSDVVNLNRSIEEIFKHDFWGFNMTENSHKSYRPLTILFFRLEYYVYGLNPFFMKIVNFLLHTLISCALIPFYKQLLRSKNKQCAFVGAIIFAIHPIHTEPVAGIVSRAELLVAILFIMILGMYSKLTAKKNITLMVEILSWILIFCGTCIAVLFKENGITILPACIIYEIIMNTNFIKTFSLPKKSFIRIAIFTIFTLIIIYLRMSIINFISPTFKVMDNPLAASKSPITRILTQNYLYALNCWILICPDWLSFDWALGSIELVQSFTDIRIGSIFLFYLFFISAIIRGTKTTFIALMLIIVPFLLSSGIIKLGFVIAERVLYIPSIGFCLFIALGFDKLLRIFGKWKFIPFSLFIIFLITFTMKTMHRSYEWSTEDLLFKSALRVCPNNAKVYYNIARLATDKNDKVTAFTYYHKAIELFPEYESAMMNLGNLYREIGDFRQAEIYLKKSINILEEFPAAWMNLGIVQASTGNYQDSLKSYEKALKYRTIYPTCFYNMGNLFIEMKNYTMAMFYWKEAIAFDRKHRKAWANILALLDNEGLTNDVLKTSQEALNFVPNDPAILFSRANAFGKLGMFQDAENIFKAIINYRPNYALYHANLGVLYHRWNKTDKAIISYRNALKLDPHLKSAHVNLQKIQQK